MDMIRIETKNSIKGNKNKKKLVIGNSYDWKNKIRQKIEPPTLSILSIDK